MTIKVLIADDHLMVAEGLRSLIEAQPDMEVVGLTDNGLDAVSHSAALNPDVVIMDNAIPIMNGTEAARRITEQSDHTRVVMLSMYSDTAHVYRALQAGSRGYVVKHCVADELVDAIRAVHSGSQYFSKPLADELLVSAAVEDPLTRLSARERQVLQMIAEGKTVADISTALSLSRKTVETYRERTMDKLGIDNFAALIRFAIQQGLTPLE